jgi:hypothetical protein
MISLNKQEENLRLRLEIKELRERELEQRKENNLKLKSDLMTTIQLKRELKMKQIIEEARLLKEQKRNNEELLKYIKIEEMANNKTKAEFIKSHLQINEDKKRAMELEKKNKIKYDLEKKLEEEQRLKQDAEGQLNELEQEEIEIMKRIRTTTQVHKASITIIY